MEMDDQGSTPPNSLLSDPISILQTLASQPDSTNTIPLGIQTLGIRDAILPGRGEIRTRGVENSASLESDMAVDMASIFRVWDLNTQSLELENGTLTDVLKELVAKTENCWFDDGQGFLSLRPPIDAFDLREMKSALEEQMIDRPPAAVEGGIEIAVAALARILRSIL